MRTILNIPRKIWSNRGECLGFVIVFYVTYSQNHTYGLIFAGAVFAIIALGTLLQRVLNKSTEARNARRVSAKE